MAKKLGGIRNVSKSNLNSIDFEIILIIILLLAVFFICYLNRKFFKREDYIDEKKPLPPLKYEKLLFVGLALCLISVFVSIYLVYYGQKMNISCTMHYTIKSIPYILGAILLFVIGLHGGKQILDKLKPHYPPLKNQNNSIDKQ